MKITIDNARLIEDGRVTCTAQFGEEGLSFEADSPEEEYLQLEAIRTDLLSRVLKRPDLLKKGAVYSIDFNYTYKE